jgi:iron(III) transport system substrate-binding protein
MGKARRDLIAIAVTLGLTAFSCGGGVAAPSPSATAAPTATAISAAAARDTLVKAAKAEGQLTWYSTESIPINDAIVAAFTKKYDIKVTVLRLAAGDMIARYSTERTAGQATADLVTWGGPEQIDANPEWYLKLTVDSVPEFATFPKGLVGWSETNMLVSLTPIVIAYNTNLVTDPPKTWLEASDPKYSGKIALTHPNGGRTYLAWAYMVSQKYGIDYLKNIAKNKPVAQPSGGPGAQQVAAGAFALSVPNSAVLVQPLKAQKAPIDMVIPNDPPIYSELRAGVASNAPHPNAAKLMLDFRASLEGQELVCNTAPGATASPRTDLSGNACLKLPAGLVPVPYSKLTPAVESEMLTALGLK